MADRRVKVVFSAEIQGFKRAMEEAAQATQKTKKASEESSKAADTYLGKLVQSANKNRDEWEKAGATMLGFGTAAVGGLALAGKAAMDWESAWAGVTKTVDGTPEQMGQLEESLRGLAKTLPATHEEIAGVAEAAGQLGVKREDVAGFTKTMIDLGETTNLTADEAATGIAQISNVMGTMARDGSVGVERFGATLVALGNAGASTEAEILDMAKRIAGAAKLVGASESDVLALSNAMASVGIEAQLGGGVISRVMQRMYEDVTKGGEGLDNLAKVAGVSSKEFAKQFGTDPVRAVDSVVKGFGRVKDAGGNVVDTMRSVGISGTEETSVILRLAGAGDLLADSLKLGDEAWKSNTALANEAAKRYETTESKVKIAWNNIKDAAIDAGAVLLPVIATVSESVAGMAKAFGSIPDPVKGVITVLGGVVGVAALGAGAFLTLTPKILDSVTAFNKLAPAGGKARGAVSTAAGIAGKAAAAYTALATAAALAAAATDGNRTKTTVEDFNNALVGVAKSGVAAEKAMDGAFKGVLNPDLMSGGTTSVNSFADALDRINHASVQDSLVDFRDTLFGQDAASGINAAKNAIGNYDKALASMATSGNFKDAASGFELAAKKAKDNGDSIETLLPLFPAYKEAILANKTANGETQVSQESLIDAMLKGVQATEGAAGATETYTAKAGFAAPVTEDMAKALEAVGIAADGSIVDIDKFGASLFAAGLLNLSASDAAIAYQDSIDKVTESVKKNGTTLDINTEKGRANQSAFNDQAHAAMTSAEATAAQILKTEGAAAAQASLQGSLRTSYDDLITAAGQFGITGDAADDMARKALGIPKEIPIDTWVKDNASAELDRIKGKADGLDGKKVTIGIYTTEYFDSVDRRSKLPDLNGDASGTGRPGLATGGRVPGYADGGQLPTSGPGTAVTDGILGISSAGVPLARVDAGEWIINRRSSDSYNRELAAINAGTFPKLPGYASGGLFSAGSFSGSAGGTVTVAAPAVTVMIGNEQLDARTYRVASSAIASADSQSQFSRRGR